MTVTNTTRNVTYAGNGTTRDFSFVFYVPSSAELKVYILDVASNTQSLLATNQYVLELNAGNEGGVVTYPKLDAGDPTPIAADKKIILQREVPATQALTFSAQSGFNPSVIEGALDKLTLLAQELDEEISRTFRLPPGSEIESIEDLYTNLGQAVADAEAAADSASSSYDAFIAALSTYENRLDDAALIGEMKIWPGPILPTRHLWCAGQNVSRTTYSALFTKLCPSRGTFTVSIASPGSVTLVAHGLSAGDRVRLSTSGALPTGLVANTDYFVASVVDANSFTLAATRGGAAINTTGTQSGTHSLQQFPWGAGDGSTTFTLPDMRGVAPYGRDNMGGTAIGKLTVVGSATWGQVVGAYGGAETGTLVRSNLPNVSVNTNTTGAHTHESYSLPAGTTISSDFSGTFSVQSQNYTAANNTSSAGDHSHTFDLNGGVPQTAFNNLSPAAVVNYIIYAGV